MAKTRRDAGNPSAVGIARDRRTRPRDGGAGDAV